MPVAADDPGHIVISLEERQAIIQKFGQMQEYIEKLEKSLKVCITTRST